MRAPFVISYSAKLKSAPSVIRNTFSASRRIAGCYDGVKGDFSMYINDLRKSSRRQIECLFSEGSGAYRRNAKPQFTEL